MGLDDFCNIGLNLGLGFTPAGKTPANTANYQMPKKVCSKATSLEPSLALAISGDSNYYDEEIELNKEGDESADRLTLYGQDSTTASSFSNTNVKREKEVSSEEGGIERGNCRASDEDDDGINARKKLRLNKDQSALLEESFKQHSNLNPKQKQELAKKLNLRPRQVEVWFQNRRARTKLKQTEIDCDFLKRCCETLTDENRRLQKELQELKSLKLPAAMPSMYMQLPAATLSMCPSCERIGGSGGANSSKIPVAPKPRLYNPNFTNPSSAAC